MARPRKPTNVLALNGTLKAHPEKARERANEPPGDGEFPSDPPEYLTADEKACWHELVATCHSGSLTANDALIVEHGARVMCKLRKDRYYRDYKSMIRWENILGRLGLTPSDRSKVSVVKPKKKGDSPLDEFAA